MIRDEQTKLTANYLNGLAIALFALGVFAPSFSVVYGSRDASLAALASILICQVLSAIIHLVARRLLRRLEHDDR
ncbi:hypothetical protein [Tranquillimonas rosea]|uniref:hypothetical protein n=1 Tax=Tranquillimonas rosea TaxID=641238 RepID=UPI003BA93081